MRRFFRLIALVGPVAVAGIAHAQAPLASALPAAPVRIDRFHAEGAFIDDPFALSADGTRLAYITTDGATRSELHLVSIGDATHAVTLPYESITPERIEFLDEERVLVVDRNPDTGFARAAVFSRSGPLKLRLGPATDVALATVQGVPAIVSYLRTKSDKGVRHDLVAYRRDNLKPLAKKTLLENGDGRVALAGGLYKPLFFTDGYAGLVAQKEGAYDKAHDIRKPDLEAHVDAFAGKLLSEREVKDLVAWTQLMAVRKKHPNERAFVRFSDDLKQFELWHDDAVAALQTPRPLGKYDPATLAYRPDGAALALSLTIDPVNPEAVRAQRADKDWIDLYRLDLKTRVLEEIARLDGEKRPSAWFLAGMRLALLRKHKGFGRGGADLEVFDLGPSRAAGSAKPTPVTGTTSVEQKASAPAPSPEKATATETKATGSKR